MSPLTHEDTKHLPENIYREDDPLTKKKCKFTELECTKKHDCDNCIVFWYGYYKDTGEIKDG